MTPLAQRRWVPDRMTASTPHRGGDEERPHVRVGTEIEHDRRRCDRDVVLAVALADGPEDHHAPERPVAVI
jgi:hypothetical protein